jgi:hypothetical protein
MVGQHRAGNGANNLARIAALLTDATDLLREEINQRRQGTGEEHGQPSAGTDRPGGTDPRGE